MTTRVAGEVDPLVDEIERLIPRFASNASKGTYGRVAVVGGSPAYTGAPYFSSMAALHTGADLIYLFTTSQASPVIKGYSPELIVHPILDETVFLDYFNERLHQFTSVIVGPGLGRPNEAMTAEQFAKLIEHLRHNHTPIVMDADALYFLAKNPSLVQNYREAILTPNMREFRRLFKSVVGREIPQEINDVDEQDLRLLARRLGNVTICVKNVHDKISDGVSCVTYSGTSGPRRCGGQGDIMAGMMATFTHWMHKGRGHVDYHAPAKPVPHPDKDQSYGTPTPPGKMPPTILACLAASVLVRKCGRSAFTKFQRGALASHFIDEIASNFHALFPKANAWVWT